MTLANHRQIAMGDALRFHAARDPDAPAYTFDGVTLTRAQLETNVAAAAAALTRHGVKEGDVVSLMVPTGPHFIALTFALWRLGATPNPLSHRLTQIELSELIGILKPRLVIGGDRSAANSADWVPADFGSGALPDAETHRPSKVASPWKIGASGGSSGRPKLVVDAAPSLIDPYQPIAVLMMKVDDVILHPAPLYHTASFTQVCWGLCAGAHVIQVSRFSPREWLELVQRHKVRWAYLVPTMMSRISDLPEAERQTADLSSLEVVIHMAAPCPEWLKAAWIDWLGPERLWEVYGGTEGIGGTSIRGVEWLSHRGSVGRPAQPVQIRAEQGDALPPGEIGEICFFVDPAHPTHRLIGADPPSDVWQSYGDLGYLDSDGYLYLVDRRTDVIISGGVNLYPAEIESGLEAHPAILSAVVVGLPHRDLQAVPHAVLQVAPDARPPATDELGQFLRRRLAPHKLPRTIEYTQVALRDESGKTRRSRLRQERLDRLAAGERFLPLGSPS